MMSSHKWDTWAVFADGTERRVYRKLAGLPLYHFTGPDGRFQSHAILSDLKRASQINYPGVRFEDRRR